MLLFLSSLDQSITRYGNQMFTSSRLLKTVNSNFPCHHMSVSLEIILSITDLKHIFCSGLDIIFQSQLLNGSKLSCILCIPMDSTMIADGPTLGSICTIRKIILVRDEFDQIRLKYKKKTWVNRYNFFDGYQYTLEQHRWALCKKSML